MENNNEVDNYTGPTEHPEVEEYMEDKTNEEDPEFWAEYRGDYLDLRDYLKLETVEEKQKLLLQWTKKRVILVREHILQIWTFNDELRDKLTPELMMICQIIYSE